MTHFIKTPRLILRQWQDKDRPLFANMTADQKVMKYFPSVLNRQQSDASIDRFMSSIEVNGWGFWAAERCDTQQFIGFIGINNNPEGLPFSPCVDIGWRLSSDAWGQGFATEGAKAVMNFAFRQANLSKIVSMTPVLNIVSERVMQKIGLLKTPQNFNHPKVQSGHVLEEHVLYSLTQCEYLSKNSGIR